MLFGAVTYLHARYRVLVLGAVVLVVGPKILLLPAWLLGVVAYYGTRASTLSQRSGALLVTGSLVAFVAFRQLGGPTLLDNVTRQWLGTEAVAALGFSKWSSAAI